jgi:hypothetical protein
MADASALGDAGSPQPDAALPAPDVLLEIERAADAGSAPYYAWLSRGATYPTETITCPDGAPTPGLVCDVEGLRLARSPSDLTVKARGYHFVSAPVLDLLEADSSTAKLELVALPEGEQTSTYATELAEGDADSFGNLSVPSTGELGRTDSLKFYIANLDVEPVVYFQNTRRFSTHFDFAHDVLRAAGTPAAFERATYQGEDRKAMAGTVTWYHDLNVTADDGDKYDAPYVLSFFSSDDLSPELARLAHRLIEERLGVSRLGGTNERLLYVPAAEAQLEQTEEQQHAFAAAGIPWARTGDLYAGITQQNLNPGVAYGTLRALTSEQLTTTALSFHDILVLEQLPAELPLVGGTITSEPQTPLAHVNLLAHSRGTPNLSLANAAMDERVAPFLDELVRFEVTTSGFSIESATQSEAEDFWAARQPPLFTPDADLEFTGLPLFEDVGFDDAVRVGTKAANLGELRQLLDDTAPKGFAIPFSAYREHLVGNLVTQERCETVLPTCATTGRAAEACQWALGSCEQASDADESLEDYLGRLLEDEDFRSDSERRDAGLAFFRGLIETCPVPSAFGKALDARVEELFGDGKVKLRSSTNVEDLADFNGAGLYESYRAYASGEERASWVVRKVWSSAWTFGAFEERAWWNVEQSRVAMGVAVNPAISDEQANGVLITGGIPPCGDGQTYVNVQVGEESVTNPTGDTIPEAYCVVAGAGDSVQAQVIGYSSLSEGKSILTDAETTLLERMSQKVVQHFAPLYGTPPSATSLDMEFKFHGPERTLLIKQVRPFAKD